MDNCNRSRKRTSRWKICKIKLIKQNKAIKLTINHFEVHSNEITAPYLYKATMNINPSWGVGEDTRNNGAAFDGNIDSTTEFGDFSNKRTIYYL